MHVTFVSQCEKKAIPKTQSTLDRYALRTGSRTWTTPITKEALSEIHVALRRKATRQTAVACFINKGNRTMKLLWIVGNKNAFGSNGEVPIATRRGTITSDKKWLPDAVMLAEVAGLTHDLGKMSLDFSSKISPLHMEQNRRDPIRHELISALIIKNMIDGKDWNKAWPDSRLSTSSQLVKGYKKSASSILFGEVDSAWNALLFLIATHHHLFEKGTSARHVRPADGAGTATPTIDSARNNEAIRRIAEVAIANFQARFEGDASSKKKWNGLSLYARAALILADQKGSSDCSNPAGIGDTTEFYANTTKVNGKSIYNQTLKHHLAKIASEAKKISSGMARSPITPLSDETKERLLKRAGKDFDWQNIAAKSLTTGHPTLLLNIAATGAGKTIMNMRAAAVLAGDAPIAITTALGLRTLTLQTGDSYKQDLKMKDDEVAIIIGCTATRILYEYEKDDEEAVHPVRGNNTESDEEDIIVDAIGFRREIPSYLQGFKKAESYAPILTTPVLVSTIDYVISAGDLTKKSVHGLALLRLMHSDLIIDEIDGFEPKSLAAILRIVKVSAMFGKNVIASSGTLPLVVAEYLLKAYEAGHQIFAAMNDVVPSFTAAVIDDSVAPLVLDTPNSKVFESAYKIYLGRLQEALIKKRITKKAVLINTPKTQDGIDEAIIKATDEMHRDHSWVSLSGKRVSIGLIRIANIKHAIRVARSLSKCKGTHVVCYHSRHFMVQRFHIEQQLDRMLRRKDDTGLPGNKWLKRFESSQEIAEILASPYEDIKFIVVATPVEEVGRDHDFDWAIIEPSSTQSIVQTAGRVNRHRKVEISCPNIGILRFNFKACTGALDVFCSPGYEIDGSHGSHDVSKLIDFSLINDRLDSSLRFDEASHSFSLLDSASINKLLIKYADFFIDGDERWISSNDYRAASLRDKSDMVEFYIQKSSTAATDSSPDFYERQIDQYSGIQDKPATGIWEWLVTNKDKMLFGLSVDEMIEKVDRAGLDSRLGLSVKCYEISESNLQNGVKHQMTNFGCVL
jgi:CRISPR-associated endonuclease/helicase Cas3